MVSPELAWATAAPTRSTGLAGSACTRQVAAKDDRGDRRMPGARRSRSEEGVKSTYATRERTKAHADCQRAFVAETGVVHDESPSGVRARQGDHGREKNECHHKYTAILIERPPFDQSRVPRFVGQRKATGRDRGCVRRAGRSRNKDIFDAGRQARFIGSVGPSSEEMTQHPGHGGEQDIEAAPQASCPRAWAS